MDKDSFGEVGSLFDDSDVTDDIRAAFFTGLKSYKNGAKNNNLSEQVDGLHESISALEKITNPTEAITREIYVSKSMVSSLRKKGN